MALYVFGGEGCGTLSKQSFTTSFHLYILLSFLNEIGAQRGRTWFTNCLPRWFCWERRVEMFEEARVRDLEKDWE